MRLSPVHVPDRELSSEQVWDNLIYFLERVVPVAEEAGVRLAIHPDDAPVRSYMGVARIIVDWDALQRVIDVFSSPCNGLGSSSAERFAALQHGERPAQARAAEQGSGLLPAGPAARSGECANQRNNRFEREIALNAE